MTPQIHIIPVPLAQEIRPGDSVSAKLLGAIKAKKLSLKSGDILIIKHKIVSKAEGQFVPLDSVVPSSSSIEWGRKYQLDPRITEIALAQSTRIVRRKAGVLITETRHGFVDRKSVV